MIETVSSEIDVFSNPNKKLIPRRSDSEMIVWVAIDVTLTIKMKKINLTKYNENYVKNIIRNSLTLVWSQSYQTWLYLFYDS